jgi:hypothetical protein
MVSHRQSMPKQPPALAHGRLWLALLGGGTAWTLHLLLAYTIAEFGCLSGLGERHFGGLSVVTWMLLGLSVLTLALALVATALSRQLSRTQRYASRDPSTAPPGSSRNPHFHGERGPEAASTVAFSGRLAYLTNLAFTFVIAVQTVPIFYFLGRC